MTNNQKYNGYANYETWNINLWLMNDQGSEQEVMSLTRQANSVHDLADSLKEMIEENNPLADKANMYTDLLNAAISECDWHELAENYWEDYKDEEEEEEE